MNNIGFFKVSACSPMLKVANTTHNADEIIRNIELAKKQKADAVCFPELSITGYTCADLFLQSKLLKSAEDELSRIVSSCKDIIAIVGIPIRSRGKLFNCAVVISNCDIIGVVPKHHIPNYNEYYEKRWFAEGLDMPETIMLCGEEVPAGLGMVFCAKTSNGDVRYGIEICEDMWVAEPPSGKLCKMGCDIIFNPSASTEFIAKHYFRRLLISQQSVRGICGYVYASASRNESTTDVVFSGYTAVFENGQALKEGERFKDQQLITADIDIAKIEFMRAKNTTFFSDFYEPEVEIVHTFNVKNTDKIDRFISSHPFVPQGSDKIERLQEIISIQTSALIKRLEHIGIKKVIIGISGGMDSTLCLLVAYRAFSEKGWDTKGIIALTMPGFGTTDRTKNNAVSLAEQIGCTLRTIDIKKAVQQHFCDIGHDGKTYDIAYENSQARERTQIIMDTANIEGALALGTGDLSELALGWCTYNADHMSMYNVNCSIPKTLIKSLTVYLADEIGGRISTIADDILKTPISPELLPTDGKNITQKTENTLGKYDLHDFFLYNMLEIGASPAKLYFLAKIAFDKIADNDEILKALKIFIKRFFSQQFKRNCMPDGPKVGAVSLSPRGDLRMPSDVSAEIWLNEVESLK